MSAGVIFIDLVSAFASVGRRLAIPCMPTSEEGWRAHLLSLGFDHEESDQIVGGAITLLQWKENGASEHAVKLLERTHAKSWFSTDGLAGVVQFTLGTLAGTSLADLVFILCMAVVLRRIDRDIVAAGLATSLPTSQALRFFGIVDDDRPLCTILPRSAWVDDLAVPFVCRAEQVQSKAKAIMAIIWFAFRSHAMEIYMKAGKSELLPMYAGPNADLAKKKEAKLPCDPDTAAPLLVFVPALNGGKSICLRIVKTYTHMGKRTMASGAQMTELTARHNSTLPFANRLAWIFFRGTSAPTKKKLLVASSLLLSKELYGAGSAPVLLVGERQKLHSNVMSVVRKATCSDMGGTMATMPKVQCHEGADYRFKPDLLSDAEVLNIFECRAPYTFVRFLRLRLSVRFALRATEELMALVFAARQDSRSWIKAIESDLKWARLCDDTAAFNITEWFSFARS